MSETVTAAVRFLIYALAATAVVFAFWAGAALVTANGQSQTCARAGGHWVATDTVAQGGVDRVRECQR